MELNLLKMRDSFIFYRSFFEATKPLSTEQKGQLYDAICLFSLEQETIELDPICKAMFSLIQPQLEANHRRYENGTKKKQTRSKAEAKPKQTISKKEANVNVNVNDNVNLNPNLKETIKEYNTFCQNKFGAPSNINGMEVKAMKSILVYLKKLCKSKGDDSDQQIIKSWRFILSGWDKLEPFLQKQIKLSQINSNLTNIINQLKNGDKKKSSSIADEILSKYN
tara:strand:+ start:420 stop:1088 length:669 start_codon:yes stop_codon:yes gene_type:complete